MIGEWVAMTRFGGHVSSIGAIPIWKSALHGCLGRRSVSAKSLRVQVVLD